MTGVTKPAWGRILAQGAVAGIAGGILIDAFLYVTSVLPQHGSMLAVWTWIASTAVGKVAFTSPQYAWLGLLMHAAVSIGWATGYAYLANSRSSINAHAAISGIVFGAVVYVVMQIVLLGDNAFSIPTMWEFADALVAHCIFFGLPVALAVRSQMRAYDARA